MCIWKCLTWPLTKSKILFREICACYVLHTVFELQSLRIVIDRMSHTRAVRYVCEWHASRAQKHSFRQPNKQKTKWQLFKHAKSGPHIKYAYAATIVNEYALKLYSVSLLCHLSANIQNFQLHFSEILLFNYESFQKIHLLHSAHKHAQMFFLLDFWDPCLRLTSLQLICNNNNKKLYIITHYFQKITLTSSFVCEVLI